MSVVTVCVFLLGKWKNRSSKRRTSGQAGGSDGTGTDDPEIQRSKLFHSPGDTGEH